jgi:glycosyltransferase involved in cell wall biosynthesis
VRRRFRLDGTLILAVGTVEPRKGINLLIDTARAAARQGREWTFVLAGALGFRGAELAEAAKAAGCVVLGPVEDADLPDLYCAADVLVAPSLHEGFGLTPLEAMACGTPPVIAADAGALEEVTGSAAIVVRERSAAAWIAAIDEAIARRGDLGRAGIAQAAKFTWPKAARRVRETLEEAAGR